MNTIAEYPILVADDDEALCRVIAEYLTSKGYTTIRAHNGKEALDSYYLNKPQCMIVDIKMPVMDGLTFLEKVRTNGAHVPVIMTTGDPDVQTAIRAIQSGAFDFLVKPLDLEVLAEKVSDAIAQVQNSHEQAVISELTSLHEISNKLTHTQDLTYLLDVTLKCCLELTGADSGSIMLVNKMFRELVIVQHKGVLPPMMKSSIDSSLEWPIAKWVLRNSASLLITDDKIAQGVILPLERRDIKSSICVPLFAGTETIGVINLNRLVGKTNFNSMHQKIVEVLSSQAGIAINNANLYTSINQKLEELSLISNYSEQLMGLVDREDVIGCLFHTVKQYFPIDVIGYLATQKRRFEFIYWSRGPLGDDELNEIRDEVVNQFNTEAHARVSIRRVALRRWPMPSVSDVPIHLPLLFRHSIRINIEENEFGMLYFGAGVGLDNLEEKMSLLSSLINQTRIALTNAKLYGDMKENYIKTIKALAIAVDAKDTYTHGHSENVMNIAAEISQEMGLDEKQIGTIRDGALLHDIGKIGIPGYILNKPGSLTYEEFNGIMKTHAALGANIVKDVPFLRDLYKLILCHHENYDGSGYPAGLKGEDIPFGARILHVADAFEAMTSNRPYRTSLGQGEAIKRLALERGSQFDPTIVDAFFCVAKRKGWLS